MAKKISYYRNKADRLWQEKGREMYKFCLICGSESCCLHHFIPKGRCSALRYDFDNGIPICNSCHIKIHKAQDPMPTATILKKKGTKWLNRIKRKREKIVKINIGYYKNIIELLTK